MALQPKSGLCLLLLRFLKLLFRHSVRLLWTSDQPVSKASTYTGQHNSERQGQTSTSYAGFEPTFSGSKRPTPKTYASYSAPTETVWYFSSYNYIRIWSYKLRS